MQEKLEMLSVENKQPTFNNLMSKETLYTYISVQVTLTLNMWPWLNARKIKPSHHNWWLFLYVKKLTFYFHDLELDFITLVLKLELDMVVTY